MNKSLKSLIVGFTIFISALFSLSFAADDATDTVNEVRILIDVSGSMKQNDPRNLRIPAIQLMVNLLPQGTRAGIWLFAEDTQVLVPFGVVSEEWKEQALKSASSVHSRGLLTDIEKSLQVASDDWIGQPGKHRRNLILLTDGVVDVAKDFMQSADSRERIITDLIPFLQQSEIQVNTIALSSNADTALLEKLAIATNGWSENVDSAERLQRVFLKMFQKAVPRDTVPIRDNKFVIDSSIKEFSLLVFRRAGAPVSKLVSPDKQEITTRNVSETVQWLLEENYDLVTIKQPQAGEWQLIAEVDPDNQVMIITDLKLNINELTNHVGVGESLVIKSHLSDQDKLITREDFLKLITLTIQQTDAAGKINHRTLQAMPGKTGYFIHLLSDKSLTLGKHTIKLQVDGKTFTREINRSIEVVEKPVKIETEVNQAERSVTVKLIPDEKIIDPAYFSIQAVINKPATEPETVNVKPENGSWSIVIKAAPEGEKIVVNFSIMAKSLSGDPISPNILPVTIDDGLFQIPQVASVEGKGIEPDAVDENQSESGTSKNEESEEEQAAGQQVNWKITSIVVIAINLLIIIAGYFIYRYQKKSTAKKQSKLLGRLS